MSYNVIVATREYLTVEVRGGTSAAPEMNPTIRPTGPMHEGEEFGYECVSLFYRREGLPMQAGSGWTFWSAVTLGEKAEF